MPQPGVPAGAPAKATVNWLLIAIIAILVFILGVLTTVLILKH
jgi:hypothetical protein